MREREFADYCRSRGLEEERVAQSVAAVRRLEEYLTAGGDSLDLVSADTMRRYIGHLIEAGDNSADCLLALARYVRLYGPGETYVYLVGTIGGRTVLPSIAGRTEELAGAAARAAVFDNLEQPPLGAGQEAYPAVTNVMVRRLQSQVSEEACRQILAGNHHRVPVEAFEPLRDLYLAEGIDAVLNRRRDSLLAELEEHARSGEPWYEQLITPAVVDYVRANPEIQAGVRRGDQIIVAKIPYAPTEYLATADETKRRYYQCHCPLARAGILEEGGGVDPVFCYCSGGYEKLPFDVIFAQPTEVEVLESALGGSTICRFAIQIPCSG